MMHAIPSVSFFLTGLLVVNVCFAMDTSNAMLDLIFSSLSYPADFRALALTDRARMQFAKSVRGIEIRSELDPVVELTEDHEGRRVRALFKCLRAKAPEFVALGGPSDKMLIIRDPKRIEPVFILSPEVTDDSGATIQLSHKDGAGWDENLDTNGFARDGDRNILHHPGYCERHGLGLSLNRKQTEAMGRSRAGNHPLLRDRFYFTSEFHYDHNNVLNAVAFNGQGTGGTSYTSASHLLGVRCVIQVRTW